MRFEENSLFKLFYKALFYFELGKNQIARVYQFIPDMIIILGGLKFLLGINITPAFSIIFVLIAVFLFTLAGFFISKTGLYSIDRKVQASKDPVQKEIYEAALKINRKA